MGRYCFARCLLWASSVVVCNTAGRRVSRPVSEWAVGRSRVGRVGGRVANTAWRAIVCVSYVIIKWLVELSVLSFLSLR